MKRKIFEDFVTEMPAPKETIEKYRGKLPAELIEAWEQYGFGTFLNGYLKMVNPDEYQELLREMYYTDDTAIPIFVTAFADIITWEEDEFIYVIDVKHQCEEDLIAMGFEEFCDNVEIEMTQQSAFDIARYEEAVNRFGTPAYSECFGYFPLLMLGGAEKVENLQKVDLPIHMDIMVQFMAQYDNLAEQILEATKGMSEEEKRTIRLNVQLIYEDKEE